MRRRTETREPAAPECRCQCEAVTGERCPQTGPLADTTEIQWIRPDRRAAAVAADCAVGFTERLRLHHECAARLIRSSTEWVWLGREKH